MGNNNMYRCGTKLTFSILIIVSFIFSGVNKVNAKLVCSSVKIEIKQELTLERQAFDAHMRINNGLEGINLEDVNVVVDFSDEEGSEAAASFFIRVDTMDNINNVTGQGVVDAGKAADIHWLIIPVPGASGGIITGKLYNVGATLTYSIGGETHETKVSPDYIFVKPMPELVLDYFLPGDVYGDDPETENIIEPIEPFNLGVRVKNNGLGIAQALKIDSAQPKIVENKEELLINFFIDSCSMNDNPEPPGLLINFGNISPNESKLGRWVMHCPLTGRFKEFTAEYTHSDELGGELTSLINSVNTHFLVRDVISDLPGKDAIRDFLTIESGDYKIYESDSTETAVYDQSSVSQFVYSKTLGTEAYYTLSTPVTAGYMMVSIPDPFNGKNLIKRAVRSDGKAISLSNVWFSKSKDELKNWHYYLNLFDVNSNGSYTIVCEDESLRPQPPTIQYISEKNIVEGQRVTFLVEADDPNETVPQLTTGNMPAGSSFTQETSKRWEFDWQTVIGQAGKYTVSFNAYDGKFTTIMKATINVFSAADTDNDGMKDSWEMDRFGNLERNGLEDSDNDGIDDLTEYLIGGNTEQDDNVPGIPDILAPLDSENVNNNQPNLIVANSSKLTNDPTTYYFELYSDKTFRDLVYKSESVEEGTDTTSWAIPEKLVDNSDYFWRVRSSNYIGYSLWNYGYFRVNTGQNFPTKPINTYPESGRTVATVTPVLSVNNSTDDDNEAISYSFSIFTDELMSDLVIKSSSIQGDTRGETKWIVPDSVLEEGHTYYWLATAVDSHGNATAGDVSSFFIDISLEQPLPPTVLFPEDGDHYNESEIYLEVLNSEASASIEKLYIFEIDSVNTFDSINKKTSEPVAEGSVSTSWYVSDLEEDTIYFWRVKVVNENVESPWNIFSFFVSTMNNNPEVPIIKNPGSGAWVRRRLPEFSIFPAADPEKKSVSYRFEIATDELMTNVIDQIDTSENLFIPVSELEDNHGYYFRVRSEDEQGYVSDWSIPSFFFVKSTGINNPPSIIITEPSQPVSTSSDTIRIKWSDFDQDSNASVSLYYDTDNQGNDGILIKDNIDENPDGNMDEYDWDIASISGNYYIYAVITDGHSSMANYSVSSITIARDRDNDGIPDHLDAFPDNPDEWEDTDNDGTGDNADLDDDNDQLSDIWESTYGFDTKDSSNASEDPDDDSYDNLSEYKADSNPVNKYSVPSIETFENGNFESYSWNISGNSSWIVVDDSEHNINPDNANMWVAKAPDLEKNATAALSVKMYCEDGVISFGYSLKAVANYDYLTFYIDDISQIALSGMINYARSEKYSVTQGLHEFRWELKTAEQTGTETATAWLDNIKLPESVDTDSDLMPDRWELEYGLNPLMNDASLDSDADGFINFIEFIKQTAPDNALDYPQISNITESFESGTFGFSILKWFTGGNQPWIISDNDAYHGTYSAESPMLANDQYATLDTIAYCEKGNFDYRVMTDTQENADVLNVYIDDDLKHTWSGKNQFILSAAETVSAGIHTFSWQYLKDSEGTSGADVVRLDSVTLPGYVDSDTDGIPDGWELINNMNPLVNDSEKDADGNGVSNIDEYTAATSPRDNSSPLPDPPGFELAPVALDKNTIEMRAATSTDTSGVQYLFEETSGNTGGSNSIWQDSQNFTDTDLQPGIEYSYRVKTRDKSANYNETVWSEVFSATTTAEDKQPPVPNPAEFASSPSDNGSQNSITMTATTASDPGGVEYYFEETSNNPGGNDSGWQENPSYTDTGLNANTSYSYRVKYRDKSEFHNETSWSQSVSDKTKKSGCGAAPMYDRSGRVSIKATKSIWFATVPLIPALISLLVWLFIQRRREKPEVK